MIRRQATAFQTALAASRAEDHLQDGCADVQGPEHRNTSLPQSPHTDTQSPHTDTRLCVEPLLVWRSVAGTTFQKN